MYPKMPSWECTTLKNDFLFYLMQIGKTKLSTMLNQIVYDVKGSVWRWIVYGICLKFNCNPEMAKITFIKVLSWKVFIYIKFKYDQCINNNVHESFRMLYRESNVLNEICPLCFTTQEVLKYFQEWWFIVPTKRFPKVMSPWLKVHVWLQIVLISRIESQH